MPVFKPIPYTAWRYLVPPRPKFALTYDRIQKYENDGWVAQYKKNGTSTILWVSPNGEFTCMNRHGENHKQWELTQHLKKIILARVPKGVWTALIAELMHSKTEGIKNTLYFHDIVVHKSQYLLGTSFEERQKILRKMFPTNVETKSHYVYDPFLWVAKIIKKDILKHYHEIKDSTVDEGLVLKNPQGILYPCAKDDSNASWQFKVRYANKNYAF